MNALTYTFETVEPLLATQPHSGEANSATSYDYVPGAMIRGALIGAYLRQTPNDALHLDPDGRRLFFEGATRYLNAYPAAPDDGQRLLPKPASWFIDKDQALADDDVFIADFAAGGAEHENSPTHPKPPPGEFCRINPPEFHDHNGYEEEEEDAAASQPGAALHEAEHQITVHNASSDRNEKRVGTSQVFRYDALAAGQSFTGVILSDHVEDLTLLAGLLRGGLLRLGGAGAGGYGRVEIRQVSEPMANWREYAPDPRSSGRRLIVTLLSDAILPGETPPPEQLARLFGAQCPAVAFQQSTLVGGFNRTWGLPLPQSWALRAGSVFVLAVPADVAVLTRLEEEGIGLRRLDGFGRIAVNWQGAPLISRTGFEDKAVAVPPLGPAGRAVAQRMTERMLRDYLERQLLTTLNRYSHGGLRELPSVAQLSRLRLAARRAYVLGQLQPIADHIDSLSKGSRQQWESARAGSQPLLPWLKALATPDEQKFMGLLQINTGKLPLVAGQRAQLTPALLIEFTARFIDGLMKQAARQKKSETTAQGDKR